MDYRNGQHFNSCFSFSLWQDETLLGWYRTKDFYPEGMLLNSALDFLHDDSIVTVLIELKKQGEYTFQPLKALVRQQSDATELLWVNQNADLPSLIPYIAMPSPVERLRATAQSSIE